MDTGECIRTAAAVREYGPKPVKSGDLKHILDSAVEAPSSGNVQDWRFVVVRDPGIKDRLSEVCMGQDFIKAAPLAIVVCSDQTAASAAYGERGIALYSIQNTACACQNIILSAWERGIGSCWVGAFNEMELKKLLNIPEDIRPVAIITLGYPKNKVKKRGRNPSESVTYFEAYGKRI